jgi:hypothetical protein
MGASACAVVREVQAGGVTTLKDYPQCVVASPTQGCSRDAVHDVAGSGKSASYALRAAWPFFAASRLLRDATDKPGT